MSTAVTLSPSPLTLPRVSKYLKQFSNDELINVGVQLGLSYSTLNRMSSGSLLNGMVHAWLRADDDVGEPSWEALCAALTECGHQGIASDIKREGT